MRKYELDYLLQSDEIQHHGVLGQKWGVRRYQNTDGSLTAEGRKYYATKTKSAEARGRKWGTRLKDKDSAYKVLSGHKLYTGTRGAFRRSVGTQRKAAFVKGMYEGSTGKKMSKSDYHKLQDDLSKDHKRHLKTTIIRATIAAAVATGSLNVVNASFSPAMQGSSSALAAISAAGVANSTASLANKGVYAFQEYDKISNAFRRNKHLNKKQYR